jgi:hypothetical protein
MNGMKDLSRWVGSGFIWLDGDRICYRFPNGILSPDLRQKLSENKEHLVRFFHLDEVAKKMGWLSLCWGMAYEQQLSPTTYIYLLKEEGGWVVWRGTWIATKGKSSRTPLREKLMAEGISFEEAMTIGNDYVRWWGNGRERVQEKTL